MNQSYNSAEKTFISVDVEHTGESDKGPGSIVSIGACVVGDITNAFYRELKPRNEAYHPDALAVASKKLLSVDAQDIVLGNEEILSALTKNATPPAVALQEYSSWVDGLGFANPVEAAAPVKYDGGLMAEYYREYGLSNPFGWNGEDINSLFRGFMGDPDTHIVTLGLREEENPHNALRDAQIQGIEMEVVLLLMQMNKSTHNAITELITNSGIEELHNDDRTRGIMTRAKQSIAEIHATPVYEQLELSTYPLLSSSG